MKLATRRLSDASAGDVAGLTVEGEPAPNRSKPADINFRIDPRGALLPESQRADFLSYIEGDPVHGTPRAASQVWTFLCRATACPEGSVLSGRVR